MSINKTDVVLFTGMLYNSPLVKIGEKRQFQVKIHLVYTKNKKLKPAFIAIRKCKEKCKVSPSSC